MQDVFALADEDSSDFEPPMMRVLQQAAAPAGTEKVTYVATPDELMAALAVPAQHIAITEHLDLTNLEPSFNYQTFHVMMNVSSVTSSIRVCSSCL
jgi:hypothetical protein